MCGKKKNLLKGEHRLCRIYKYKVMSIVACTPTPNGETNSVRWTYSKPVCVNWGWLNPRCHVPKKNFIVIPERLVTRLNLFISIIPASSRTVKILSPMTHPIPQNVFIIPLPDCLLVVIVQQVLIFLFSHFRLVSGLWSLDIPL